MCFKLSFRIHVGDIGQQMKHIQLSLRSLKPCFAVLFCPDLRSYKPCFAVDRNPFAVNHIYIGIFLFVYSNNLAKTYVPVLLF